MSRIAPTLEAHEEHLVKRLVSSSKNYDVPVGEDGFATIEVCTDCGWITTHCHHAKNDWFNADGSPYVPGEAREDGLDEIEEDEAQKLICRVCGLDVT